MEEKLAKLEALLFLHGEPMSGGRIERFLGLENGEAGPLTDELERRLTSSPERGLTLVRDSERVQLATQPRFGEMLQEFVKAELSAELTPASLEALSIVAYFGPISRSRIEYVRGVNSSFILRSLLLRGLIERLADPARPTSYLYRPSFEFLRHIGVERQERLPDFEKYGEILARFEADEERGVSDAFLPVPSGAESLEPEKQ